MDTKVQDIIADPSLSVEAKAILVSAEIANQVQASMGEKAAPQQPSTLAGIEINLIYEDVPFHPYRASIIPRTGELISCRLEVGKGMLATLWKVVQVEHGVGLDYLGRVDLIVEPADEQTAMHWRRRPRKKAE